MKKRNLLVLSATILALGACTQNNPSSSENSNAKSETSSSSYVSPIEHVDPPTYDTPCITFHYRRTDSNYKNWDLYIWENNGPVGKGYEINGYDDWGAIFSYPLSLWGDPVNNSLGFICRFGGDAWTTKDVEENRFIDFSDDFKTDDGNYVVYLLTADSTIYDKNNQIVSKITMATFGNETNIVVKGSNEISGYTIWKNDEVLTKNDNAGNVRRIDYELKDGIDYSASYKVELRFKIGGAKQARITKDLIFGSKTFEDTYNYDGNDLGAIYSSSSTSFKVWSPSSTEIKLRIYESGTPKSVDSSKGNDSYQEYAMSKGDKGVFSYTLEGDQAGKYYTYVVTNDLYTSKEIVDPYAKSCGVNGLRGMIVDFSKTNPEGWDSFTPLSIDRKAMVVYETHVADITSSSTWTGTNANKKLFNGAYESGTTYAEGETAVKTGFDHIKELGVNAVQLLPIFDQANDETDMTFNWGYNPLNYNCVEGGYSSNPYDGYTRIKELKTLIKTYGEAGMNIIMDVVYNHVNGLSGSNFDVLMPGYYFRYTNSDQVSNGSGCGNETASEHYMMRKFIEDSVCYWAKEFKLGGFRFDLMGLHDLKTMNSVVAKAKQIKSDIVIYGEPWKGGTSTLKDSDSAAQINGANYEGYGAFNDIMRDALIKGGLNAVTDLGWVTNASKTTSMTDVSYGIKGITNSAKRISDPDKTVNYVTCHDNYTLHDRVKVTNKNYSDDVIKKMNILANSIVMTSQGTSFMLSGEEMLRSKKYTDNGKTVYSGNSYNLSYETNELDYSLKIKNLDMFETYKKLISLKKNLDGLHLNKDEISSLNVNTDSVSGIIEYTLKDSANNKIYKILHSNGVSSTITYDLSSYSLYLDTVNGSKNLTSSTALEPYETLIAYK